METLRKIGQNHLYFEPDSEHVSNVLCGLFMRAMGHGLSVAFVDCSQKAQKFKNFFENSCISHSFKKQFEHFNSAFFTIENTEKVKVLSLPQVEYLTLTHDQFWKVLERYDVVLFDNLQFETLSKYALISYLTSKPEKQELCLQTTSKQIYTEFEPHTHLVTQYLKKTKKEQTLSSKKNLICLTGNGKGKSTWSFGYLFNHFLNKQNVKLIYFDKGGDYYGEKHFFTAVKQWSKQHPLYGTFDFVTTGKPRFNGETFRFENTPEDINEAKEGIELLRTALKKTNTHSC